MKRRLGTINKGGQKYPFSVHDSDFKSIVPNISGTGIIELDTDHDGVGVVSVFIMIDGQSDNVTSVTDNHGDIYVRKGFGSSNFAIALGYLYICESPTRMSGKVITVNYNPSGINLLGVYAMSFIGVTTSYGASIIPSPNNGNLRLPMTTVYDSDIIIMIGVNLDNAYMINQSDVGAGQTIIDSIGPGLSFASTYEEMPTAGTDTQAMDLRSSTSLVLGIGTGFILEKS